MLLSELAALAAGYPSSLTKEEDRVVIVRYKPSTSAEARKLLETFTMLIDAVGDSDPKPKYYAGFSEDDLLDGKPGVRITH